MIGIIKYLVKVIMGLNPFQVRPSVWNWVLMSPNLSPNN
jgi:hypothetical protein